MTSTITLPIRVASVANLREHWAVKSKRAREHRTLAAMFLRGGAKRPELPCSITLIRIAPRALDSHDNLRAALKATVDGCADWLGVDDRDPRVTWVYRQERGAPRTFGVRIEIGGAP